MKITNTYPCVQVDASGLCEDQTFLEWFFNRKNNLATWDPREPGGLKELADYSDLFMWVERGEGSDSDMPEHVWNKIIETVGRHYIGIVWLTFLNE